MAEPEHLRLAQQESAARVVVQNAEGDQCRPRQATHAFKQPSRLLAAHRGEQDFDQMLVLIGKGQSQRASIRTPADFVGDAFQQAVVRDLLVSAKIPDLEGVVTRGCGDQG